MTTNNNDNNSSGPLQEAPTMTSHSPNDLDNNCSIASSQKASNVATESEKEAFDDDDAFTRNGPVPESYDGPTLVTLSSDMQQKEQIETRKWVLSVILSLTVILLLNYYSRRCFFKTVEKCYELWLLRKQIDGFENLIIDDRKQQLNFTHHGKSGNSYYWYKLYLRDKI